MTVDMDEVRESLARLAPYNEYAAAWLIRLELAESDEAREQVFDDMSRWSTQIVSAFGEFRAQMLEWAENLTRVGGTT